MNQLKYLTIAKYVKRSYIPHSMFVIIKDEYVEEVSAQLLLMGHRKQEVPLLYGAINIFPPNTIVGGGASLYRDAADEWILTRAGLEAFGIIEPNLNITPESLRLGYGGKP
jgi:hypothetical protein